MARSHDARPEAKNFLGLLFFFAVHDEAGASFNP